MIDRLIAGRSVMDIAPESRPNLLQVGCVIRCYGRFPGFEAKMTISDVVARDNELSQVAQGVHETIPAALKGTPLQHSADVLAALVWSLESLKGGILTVAELLSNVVDE